MFDTAVNPEALANRKLYRVRLVTGKGKLIPIRKRGGSRTARPPTP